MSDMSQITDYTLPPQGEAGAVVVSHGVNEGKGRAVKTSLGYAAEHGFDALVLPDGDGQHDPGEIPGLLEPMTTSMPEALSNDAADLVIGFRSFGQMLFYRRFGRAALDHVIGAGGAVTDSQSGFRALNRKAVQLLAGTLRREEIETFGIVAVEDINGWSRTVGLMAAR